MTFTRLLLMKYKLYLPNNKKCYNGWAVKIEMMKYPNEVAQNAVINSEYKDIAEKFSDTLIEEFLELCKIPHPSGHVEKMREYLLNWGKEHNIETNLDSSGCVYMDIPPSEDGQDIPNIIFQAHYDMVAVGAKDNKTFDPITSPIEPVYDKEEGVIHTKWKTSLGADDGNGIALALALAKMNNEGQLTIKHGKIRLLFTYDEETTLQGCKLLNQEVLDADYLINLDSVYVGMIITSAAGGFYATAKKSMGRIEPGKKSNVLALDIWGLTGGHSGRDINLNRGNTMAILTDLMTALLNEGINFNIRNVKSGLLMNAIPSKMQAEFVVGYHDIEKAIEVTNKVIEDAKNKYSDGKSLECKIEAREASSKPVLSISDSMKIYHILTMLPIGVIDRFEDGNVETSNNVGILDIHDDILNCEILYRSTDENKLKKAINTMTDTCIQNDIDFGIEALFPAWAKNNNNKLNDLIGESYLKTSDIEIASLDIHAGLECGYFSRKRPDISMACIGCDIIDNHSRKETMFTKSIPVYCASILYLLSHLK